MGLILRGEDTVQLVKDIEDKCNEIILRKIETRIEFSDSDVHDGKPLRTVYYGDFGINCGGTLVANLEDIGSVTIRKIKQDKDKIRVSYA
jgi:Ser-tRNA(Ala) deacylase AlaX